MPDITPDPRQVICPACSTQFAAVPEAVQADLRTLADQRDAALGNTSAAEQRVADICAALGIGSTNDVATIVERVKLAFAVAEQATAALEPANAQLVALGERIASLEGEIEKLAAQNASCQELLTDAQDRLGDANAANNALRQENGDLQSGIERATEKVAELEIDLAAARAQVDAFKAEPAKEA